MRVRAHNVAARKQPNKAQSYEVAASNESRDDDDVGALKNG